MDRRISGEFHGQKEPDGATVHGVAKKLDVTEHNTTYDFMEKANL